ncbi:MAG: zinc dependent phospholipase C family protein [Anaerolineae bacterium]|nr:zinc dependent phospholipase C family protein [Anaerolineae bacterium]
MPLPMVHLAVAVQLAAQRQQLPSPAFLLGSIAPDAIHMRLDADYEDKQRSHLNQLDDLEHRQLQALLAQYGDRAAPLPAFAAGYAAHLLTDRLWLLEVSPVFQAQVGAIDPVERRKIYYEDTDQVDFNLYHQAAW